MLKLFRDIPPDFAWRLCAYQFAISCLPRAKHAFVQTRSRIQVLVRTCKMQRTGTWRSRDLDDSATRESSRYVCITPVVGRKREVQGEIHRLDSTSQINYERVYPLLNTASVCVIVSTRYVTNVTMFVRMIRIRMKKFYIGTHMKKFVFICIHL